MTLTADRLEELEGLATICATVDPIGPGWYTYEDLSRWMEPCDARLVEALQATVVLELITAAREGAEAKAERDTLRQAKWEVKHTDTVNDMVLLGLARDSERERAERAESTLQSVQAQLDGLCAALADKDISRQEILARALSVQGEGK